MLLGLDLGTTNVKALVTDRAGQPLAHASSPVQLHYVGEGGVGDFLLWIAHFDGADDAAEVV